MDEARFGTHSKQGHGWFPTGERSRVSIKLGFKNFYVYSSVEAETGKAFSLILPKVNAELMNVYLQRDVKALSRRKNNLGHGWGGVA